MQSYYERVILHNVIKKELLGYKIVYKLCKKSYINKIFYYKEGNVMALSDAIKTEKPEVGAKTAGGNSKSDAFKANGASIRAQMSEDQKATEGSKRDKVAFVAALGDPNKKQSRVEGKEAKPSYMVVGYQFKVLEDMTVPKAPIKADFKTPLDVEAITEEPVKAGTVVSLNLVETGAFISRPEFAGQFTGEGQEVSIIAKISKDREEPKPALRMSSGTGSIKSNMVLIADMVPGEDGKNKPQIKPEFEEKFGVLYKKRRATKKQAGSGASAAGESAANIAAAFNALYSTKRA